LSFHVGSQQTTTRAYEIAIAKVGMLFTDLTEAGVNLRMMNLGGGFPTRYRDEVPAIDQFASAIMTAMTEHFGNNLPEMVIEPGRFVVGDSGLVSAEVVLGGWMGHVQGEGNGPIDAFVNALSARLGQEVRVLDYHEHAMGSGADARAVAYLELRVGEETRYGVGIDGSIVRASMQAILSGLHRTPAFTMARNTQEHQS